MVKGRVTHPTDGGQGLEARIDIDIAGSNFIFQTLAVVVDTGYTGALSLPEPIAHDLGLRSTQRRYVTLASGRTEQVGAGAARLLWHGQPIDVLAHIMGDKPMIGAALLAGSRLTIDWWDGGDVIIEEATVPAQRL